MTREEFRSLERGDQIKVGNDCGIVSAVYHSDGQVRLDLRMRYDEANLVKGVPESECEIVQPLGRATATTLADVLAERRRVRDQR